MEIIDNSKSILENLYLLSGPFLAILGVLVFRQIKLGKEQLIIAKKQLDETQKMIKINSTREAKTFAANLTKEFICEIIPLESNIKELEKENNVDKIKFEIKNFTNDEFLSDNNPNLSDFLNVPENIRNLKLDVVNRLEAFSTYFMSGIADEKVAFFSIGREFCSIVEYEYPIITLLRGSKNPHKYYNNIVELYKYWKSRIKGSQTEIEKEKLLKEKEELSKELTEKVRQFESLNAQHNPNNEIKPIGT